MSNDAQPDTEREERGSGIPRNTLDWLQQFLKIFELEFNARVAASEFEATPENLRKVAADTFVSVMLDSGAPPHEVLSLIERSRRVLLAPVETKWTEAKNRRRVELIDKSIVHRLSPEDSFELAQLTEQMRGEFDSEDFVPIEGAENLYKQLLMKAAKKRPVD